MSSALRFKLVLMLMASNVLMVSSAQAAGHDAGFQINLIPKFVRNQFEEIRTSKALNPTFGTDDNITRAQANKNIISDRFVRLDGRLTTKAEVSFNKAFILELSAGHQAHEFSESLNRTELSARLIYRWQTSFAYDSPWYQVFADYQYWLTDVEQRRSHIYTAQALASARFTTKIRWVLGLENKQRLSEGAVFDTQQNRLFANIDYDFRNGLAVYGAYGFIKGNTLSSVQSQYCNGLASTSIYALITASDDIEWDQAFSEDYCGNWISYRLDAQTHTGTLGFNYAFNHSTAIDASFLYVTVDATGDIEYQRQIFQVSLLKGF